MGSDEKLAEVLGEFARTMLTDFSIERNSRPSGRAHRRRDAGERGRGDTHVAPRRPSLCRRLRSDGDEL